MVAFLPSSLFLMLFLVLFCEATPATLKSDINNISLYPHLTSTLLVSCLPFFHTNGGVLSLLILSPLLLFGPFLSLFHNTAAGNLHPISASACAVALATESLKIGLSPVLLTFLVHTSTISKAIAHLCGTDSIHKSFSSLKEQSGFQEEKEESFQHLDCHLFLTQPHKE